ncbi:hypothetical protein [Methylomonas sp. YC3]
MSPSFKSKSVSCFWPGNLIEEKRGKAGQIVARYRYDSDTCLIRAETQQGISE